MSLTHLGYIDLPAHLQAGGFDHAAVHRASARLYVAHTCNDALDVIDCARDQFLFSIPNLRGVAGALVSDENNLVFTSNRGENTICVFSPEDAANLVRVAVGIRPNGLAYAPAHNLLLAANVGDPAIENSFAVSIVDVKQRALIANVLVPGRTRWTVFDAQTNVFYINIANPPQIVILDAEHPTKIARVFEIPAAGPHGLDLDAAQQRLLCACDDGALVTLDAHTGALAAKAQLSGAPDVIFFNPLSQHLYVAIGEPGVIEVFETTTMQRLETIQTERGAHTLGFDSNRNKVYAFLPQTHRAAVYLDE